MKKLKPKCKFITAPKYYKTYFSPDILHNFIYYVHPILFNTLKFLINA